MANPDPIDPSFAGLRILIVEDSLDISKSLSEALAMQGAAIVASVRRSSDAIDWLHANPSGSDVVIVDLFLLAGSGLDVLEAMTRLAAAPIAVVLTNYATESLRLRCDALGAAGIFDKSSEVEKLMSWLGALATSMGRPGDHGSS